MYKWGHEALELLKGCGEDTPGVCSQHFRPENYPAFCLHPPSPGACSSPLPGSPGEVTPMKVSTSLIWMESSLSQLPSPHQPQTLGWKDEMEIGLQPDSAPLRLCDLDQLLDLSESPFPPL